MHAFELGDLRTTRQASGRGYLEFLRSRDLSIGLYELPAGGLDPQTPHTEDEAYCVIAGRATITVGDEERPVTAGSVVFVGAGVVRRFHDIEEDLSLLVAFGPAEGSRTG